MNTLENNKLIAEFMGYEVIDYQHNKYAPIYNGNKYAKTIGEQEKLWGGLSLQFTGRFTEFVNYPFNSDWNYLMPIIKMIEYLGYEVVISRISCQINGISDRENPISSMVCGDISKKIEITYDAVIQFIKWYNAQNS
jgi:hypothetical protein